MGRKLKEMTILPFQVKHYDQIIKREKDILIISQDQLLTLQNYGDCYSAFYGTELIFMGGVRILHKGVGEAWVLCSKCITRFVRELYYHSNRYLLYIAKKNKLVRIQAHIDAQWREACDFIENIGFKREGLLKKCFFHRDYFIYGRIF
jgi:hypothetical protein